MWDKLALKLGYFPSAVLTGTDANGYPFSVRCTPRVDAAHEVILIAPRQDVPIQPGAAGLLFHAHNELLWDLKVIQVLGSLEQTGQGWTFQPKRWIPGPGTNGAVNQMQMIMKGRADAKQYLQKRGLARPKVHWDELEQVKKEARQARKGSNR